MASARSLAAAEPAIVSSFECCAAAAGEDMPVSPPVNPQQPAAVAAATAAASNTAPAAAAAAAATTLASGIMSAGGGAAHDTSAGVAGDTVKIEVAADTGLETRGDHTPSTAKCCLDRCVLGNPAAAPWNTPPPCLTMCCWRACELSAPCAWLGRLGTRCGQNNRYALFCSAAWLTILAMLFSGARALVPATHTHFARASD